MPSAADCILTISFALLSCTAPAAVTDRQDAAPAAFIDRQGAAVVRIEVLACASSIERRATGVTVTPDLVATVAHTFDRATAFEIFDRQGTVLPAHLVWLDAGRDLALLRLHEPRTAWLPLGEAGDGDTVDIVTIASGGDQERRSARILRHASATLDGEGRRAALELEATIRSGDSGSPVVTADGEVAGIVFATTRPAPRPGGTPAPGGPAGARGWAIASSEITTAVGATGSDPLALSC